MRPFPSLLLVCAFGLFLTSCQRNSDSRVETLNGTRRIKAVEDRWLRLAQLKIKGADHLTSEVEVGTVGWRAENGIECEILEAPPDKNAKWYPLSLRLFTPPEKRLSPSFQQTLTFDKPKQTAKKMDFVVSFEKGDLKFSALWRVIPYLSEKKGEKPVCSARAEVCVGKDVESCGSRWRWLKEIIGVPDIAAYFLGSEVLTDLLGVFYTVNEDGGVKESEPLSLL